MPPPEKLPPKSRLPLAECGSFTNRLHRVRDAHLSSTSQNHASQQSICKPIHTPLFYDQLARLFYFERHKRAQTNRESATMPSSCKDIRAALAQCLQESDCVMIYRNKPSDCLRDPLIETMPTKCQQLKKGYGDCKRGMVDMRKRFRGNQPIAVSKEIEGGESAEQGSRQLYAGKPAFGTTAKQTSGNEPIERDWRELENEKFRKGN